MSGACARLIVMWLVVLATALSCRRHLSPEDQIREAIGNAAEGVRERKVKKVVAIVSAQYADHEGRDRQAIVDLVRAQVLLRPNVYLVTRVSSVDCGDSGQCHAVVLAAMASVPAQSLSDLANSQADVYRFELTMVAEDGAWRICQASWFAASVKDLL